MDSIAEKDIYLKSNTNNDEHIRGNVNKTDQRKDDMDAETEEEYTFDDDVVDGNLRNVRSPDDQIYTRACKMVGVTPSPRLLKQLSNSDINVQLNGSVMGANDIKAVSMALVLNYTIRSLDLSGNDLGPSGASYLADALKENQSIKELNIADSNPGSQGLHIFTDMLIENKNLIKVNISGNKFGIKHVHFLIDIIKKNSYLEGLYAANNQLDTDGCILLGPAIAANDTLKVLDLSWNHIRGKGAIAICNGLAENVRLSTLDLSWNGLDCTSIDKMSDALLANSTLRTLDLSDNRLDIKALQKLLPGLVNNSSLTHLKIGKNPITTDGANMFMSAIAESSENAITNLSLENIPVDTLFMQTLNELKNRREIQVEHCEALRHNDITRHKQTSLSKFDPVSILFEYMHQKQLRVIDLFRNLDLDGSQTITKQEFKEGLMEMNIPLTEKAIDCMLNTLDRDGDDQIDLLELISGKREDHRKAIRMHHDQLLACSDLKKAISDCIDEKHEEEA